MPSELAQKYLRVGDERLALGARSILVGILNVTPDSFSDGGRFAGVAEVTERALALLDAGAGILDIGGESTRPGFAPVSAGEEIERVVPAIEAVLAARPGVLVSVDTSKAEVAAAALRAGARIVNDVLGFRADAAMAEVAARYRAAAILMRNGRGGDADGGVLDRIRRSWERSVEMALRAGVDTGSIVLDPGIGFGTTREEDFEILRGLATLRAFGFPLLLGASRKRVTAEPLGLPIGQRLETTLATTAGGIAAGVEFFRVHDVAEHARFVSMADVLFRKAEKED